MTTGRCPTVFEPIIDVKSAMLTTIKRVLAVAIPYTLHKLLKSAHSAPCWRHERSKKQNR